MVWKVYKQNFIKNQLTKLDCGLILSLFLMKILQKMEMEKGRNECDDGAWVGGGGVITVSGKMWNMCTLHCTARNSGCM